MPSTKPAPRFRPVADVALVTGRTISTIHNWVAAGHIDRCDYRGRVWVDLVAAQHRSEATPRRRRAHAA